MKKSTLLLAGLLAAGVASADEGMWTLYSLPQAVYEQIQAQGFQVPYNDLYYSDQAMKNAMVNFSGYCTGAVVSPDGLVFTNHHCDLEGIRNHSIVKHNYMKSGFYARNYEGKLPNKDMFMSFMVGQKDVINGLRMMDFDNLTTERQDTILDSLQNAMSGSIKCTDKTLYMGVDASYKGNTYHATTYRQFNGLRLALAAPKSMGKFGGETDSWMQPRQTHDFSVFRIYADKETNGPAECSEDNVPYHPKKWAQASLQGYKGGDYSMAIGYPGSTSRYLSSYGICERRDALSAPRTQVYGVKQTIMTRHMRANDGVRIRYDSEFTQSSDYWKNSIGMNKCVDSISITNQEQQYEQRIHQWQRQVGYLKGKLDFGTITRLYNQHLDVMKAFMFFREAFDHANEFATRAIQLNNKEILDPKNNPKKQYILFKDNSDEWDEALDKEAMTALLKNYRDKVAARYLPKFYQTITTKYGGDYTRYANELYRKSFLMKSGKRIYANKKSYQRDPGVVYSLGLLETMGGFTADLSAFEDSIKLQEKYLCAAKLRMEEDMPHCSDTNFTMRLSYGQVGGFLLGGKPSGYYATVESMVEKMNQADKVCEYQAGPVMKGILSTKDFGLYQGKHTGKM